MTIASIHLALVCIVVNGSSHDAMARSEKCVFGDALKEGSNREKIEGGVDRPPVRPSSAPPVRGRRPRVNARVGKRKEVAAETRREGGGDRRGGNENEKVDSGGGSSHDLEGFEELEGPFSYEDYPVAGSQEEPEWVHVPWCGSDGICNPGIDGRRSTSPAYTPLFPGNEFWSVVEEAGKVRNGREGEGRVTVLEKKGDGGVVEAEDEGWHQWPHSSASGSRFAAAAALEKSPKSTDSAGCSNAPVITFTGDDHKKRDLPPSRMAPRTEANSRWERSAPFGRLAKGGEDTKRYNWDASKVPERPSLLATSRISSGSRIDKMKARKERRREPSTKVMVVCHASTIKRLRHRRRSYHVFSSDFPDACHVTRAFNSVRGVPRTMLLPNRRSNNSSVWLT